jgi:hypothetical protein
MGVKPFFFFNGSFFCWYLSFAQEGDFSANLRVLCVSVLKIPSQTTNMLAPVDQTTNPIFHMALTKIDQQSQMYPSEMIFWRELLRVGIGHGVERKRCVIY